MPVTFSGTNAYVRVSQKCARKNGNQQGIDQVDEKRAHQRNDNKRQVRSAIALSHRRHVRHGGRGRAQRDAAEAGADDGRIVIAPHQRETPRTGSG